jgi:hypothetical protein
MKNAYKILLTKPEGRDHLGTSTLNKIKILPLVPTLLGGTDIWIKDTCGTVSLSFLILKQWNK